ncbi:MAG: glycosyltransferase [Thermoanaerobaculia bacterium]
MRERLGRELLSYVEDLERRSGPVGLVFIYAAGTYVDPQAIRELAARGIWTVLLSLDDKQQMPPPGHGRVGTEQLDVATEVDLYWTTWRAGADWLSKRGARPWYAPEAADPSVFAPRNLKRDIAVLWLGRAYGPRAALVHWLMDRGIAVQAFGEGWPAGRVPLDEMISLISRAEIVLGMGGVGQTDKIKHLKGRDFEVPMCGAAYVTSFNPELTDSYVIGSEVACYSSREECAETIRYLSGRPDLLERMRRAARARCVSDHTWDARINQLLALLSASPE